MSRQPNQGTTVLLYIVAISAGIGLLLGALVLLLLGIGVVKQVPPLVLWALGLFSVGIGILAGLSMNR
ncbi:MAG: hypothetical protein WA919_11330 [Coleofasciculaceae cyanobacterium]